MTKTLLETCRTLAEATTANPAVSIAGHVLRIVADVADDPIKRWRKLADKFDRLTPEQSAAVLTLIEALNKP